MSTKTKAGHSVLGDFKIAPARKVQFERAIGAESAPVEPLRAGSDAPMPVVTRGKRVRDGLPHYFVQNGDAQIGFPVCAVGALVAGGIITLPQIAALLLNTDDDDTAARGAAAITAALAALDAPEESKSK